MQSIMDELQGMLDFHRVRAVKHPDIHELIAKLLFLFAPCTRLASYMVLSVFEKKIFLFVYLCSLFMICTTCIHIST